MRNKKFNYDTTTIYAIEFYTEADILTTAIILDKNLVKEYLEAKEKFEELLSHLTDLIEEEENRVWQ